MVALIDGIWLKNDALTDANGRLRRLRGQRMRRPFSRSVRSCCRSSVAAARYSSQMACTRPGRAKFQHRATRTPHCVNSIAGNQGSRWPTRPGGFSARICC